MPRGPYFVYIMASRRNGTLYVGVTNDLARRASEHRLGTVDGFTRKHGVKLLVWSESFIQITDAIACEKRIKRWRRAWKLGMIERANPDWQDIFGAI